MTEEEIKAKAVETLSSMIDLLGLDAEIEYTEAENGDKQCSLKTSDAGRLIGRKGQSLASLELLLNRILKRNDEDAPWVALELDGYTTGFHPGEGGRGGRDHVDTERFTQMAIDAAKEVKRWNIEKKLGPFAPGERRAIHIALKEDTEVVTESEVIPDDKFMKYVIVRMAEK